MARLQRLAANPTVGRLLALLTLLALLALAWHNAAGHLLDPIWQDESASLLNFANDGWLAPFFVYRMPNNHILYSAMQAAWLDLFHHHTTIGILRTLPFALFLLSVLATWFAARRMGGALCATLACLLFASSAVAANFAAQLRGYSASWLFFSGLLWCALNLMAPRRAWWRAGYLACCFCVGALLPSNLFQAFAVGVAASAWLLAAHPRGAPGRRSALALLLLGPFLGLLAYVFVWSQLREHSAHLFSHWTRPELLRAWWQGTHGDNWWLLPLAGAGLVAGLLQCWHAWRNRAAWPAEFVLAAALLAGLLSVLALMPQVPFPRTLVTYLPLWYCAIASLCLLALRELFARRALAPMAVAALLTGIALFTQQPISTCRGASSSPSDYEYDLCYQYFHDRYEPVAVARTWAQLGRADVPIASDYEGYFALRVLGVPGLQVYLPETWPHSAMPAPLVVAHGPAGLAAITGALSLPASRYVLVADSGYFQVWSPPDYVDTGAPQR